MPLGKIHGTITFVSHDGSFTMSTPFGTFTSNELSTVIFPFDFENTLTSWDFVRVGSVVGVSPSVGINIAINTGFSTEIPVPLQVKVINSSIEPVPTLPVISNPVPVSLINPGVVPVQIENVDPIEVEFAIGEPLPVSIINPAVIPVQIDNVDPIEVTIPTTAPIPITGQVSIANPIPSVASTILNAFKK
jgi:hypothetical protein